MHINKFLKQLSFFSIIVLVAVSCGPIKKPDWGSKNNTEVDGKKRAQQNVREGRGISILGGGKKSNGDFLFASSNPMWKASLEILDFISLSVVDYSGGVLITDWYTEDGSTNQAIKITVRFLSNEIRADGLSVRLHKRTCKNTNCVIKELNSDLSNDIKESILKKATILKKEIDKTGNKKRSKKVFPGEEQ